MYHDPSSFLLYFTAYLLGSIPFGLLLTRMAGLGDIRKVGSGNIGATNVMRTGNKKLAIATLLLDALKGAAAVMLGGMISPMHATLAGLFSVIGHVFPLWLKFRGGKGVATAFGVLFAVNWLLGLAVAATWLCVFLMARISSLSGLVAFALAPVYCYFIIDLPTSLIVIFVVIIIILRHHENIRRLVNGEEKRMQSAK